MLVRILVATLMYGFESFVNLGQARRKIKAVEMDNINSIFEMIRH